MTSAASPEDIIEEAIDYSPTNLKDRIRIPEALDKHVRAPGASASDQNQEAVATSGQVDDSRSLDGGTGSGRQNRDWSPGKHHNFKLPGFHGDSSSFILLRERFKMYADVNCSSMPSRVIMFDGIVEYLELRASRQ